MLDPRTAARLHRLVAGELPYGIQPGFEEPPPGRCQFIAGRPGPDDACKCGRPTRPGSSFCQPHHARCWTPVDPVTQGRPRP